MASTKALSTSGVQSSSTAKISTARRGKSKKSYPPRKCNYCKGLFIPFQSHQRFCSENHQKLYWKYGTIPFEKLARRLELRFEQEVEPLRLRVAELEQLVTEARAESSRALCLFTMQDAAEAERQHRQHTARVLNAGGGAEA